MFGEDKIITYEAPHYAIFPASSHFLLSVSVIHKGISFIMHKGIKRIYVVQNSSSVYNCNYLNSWTVNKANQHKLPTDQRKRNVKQVASVPPLLE
jgi:hypothetical protein